MCKDRNTGHNGVVGTIPIGSPCTGGWCPMPDPNQGAHDAAQRAAAIAADPNIEWDSRWKCQKHLGEFDADFSQMAIGWMQKKYPFKFFQGQDINMMMPMDGMNGYSRTRGCVSVVSSAEDRDPANTQSNACRNQFERAYIMFHQTGSTAQTKFDLSFLKNRVFQAFDYMKLGTNQDRCWFMWGEPEHNQSMPSCEQLSNIK